MQSRYCKFVFFVVILQREVEGGCGVGAGWGMKSGGGDDGMGAGSN